MLQPSEGDAFTKQEEENREKSVKIDIGKCMNVWPQDDHLFFRFLCGDDVPQLQSLCQELFPVEYPEHWYVEIAQSPDKYYSLVVSSRHQPSRILGLMVAEVKTLNKCNKEDRDILSKSFPANTKVAYLLSLGVTTQCRRRGLATRLLDHLVTYLTFNSNNDGDDALSSASSSAKAIYLHVLCENQMAINFYTRRHFKRHVRLKNYYKIDGELRDGYSYVLYINGGRPASTCVDICEKIISVIGGIVTYPLRRLNRLLFSWILIP